VSRLNIPKNYEVKKREVEMSVFSERRYNRIVWAMNPFEQNEGLDEACAALLKRLQGLEEYEVYPVFSFSPRYFLNPEFKFQSGSDSRELFPLERMKKKIERLKLKNVREPILLPTESPSVRKEVELFLQQAEEIEPSLILLAAHEKTYWSRFTPGSFSDLLLRKSKFPLMILPENYHLEEDIKNIFYATDLGDHSKEGLFRTFDLAKIFNAKVTVFHSALPEKFVSQFSEYNILGIDAWPTFMSKESKKNLANVKQDFESEAKRLGIGIDFLIEESDKSVEEAISKKVRQVQPQMIVAMAKRHGIFVESVGARIQKMIREASCPVYIFHSMDQSE